MSGTRRILRLVESGRVPDAAIRWGVRRRLRGLLRALSRGTPEERHERERALLAALRAAPIALATDAANAQHYEVPAAFFDLVLGARKKYSACLWTGGIAALDEAELAMLRLTAERAGLADGMRILDLGCGWGSFCLWAAETYPASRIVAVSNSRLQRAYIEERARERGLANLEVRTADVASFEPGGRFDRVVSIEMFEHLRNVEAMLARIAGWLAPGGRLFLHVFSHREFAYTFDALGDGEGFFDSEFFTGGMMPSDALYLNFQRDLVLGGRWIVGGLHYARTLRAWLDRLDERHEACRRIFAERYGAEADVRLQRWRLFFIACEESFGLDRGEQWRVSHYLFEPRA